jgi:hypothetical protein
MAAVIRTFIVTGALSGIVLLAYWRLSFDQKQRQIAQLQALNDDMARRLASREAMIQRLSRTRRIAYIDVVDQRLGPAKDVLETDLVFIELDSDGSEIARQSFTIPGDVLFVDAFTVKFAHEDVASGHPLMGRTLVLLRRLYSDRMAPADGFTIDTPGAVPPAYASGEVGRFEQQIWRHFWEIATDPERAANMGVRVAQGEAVYKPVRTGASFELIADAAGGISLVPLAADDGLDDPAPSDESSIENSPAPQT